VSAATGPLRHVLVVSTTEVDADPLRTALVDFVREIADCPGLSEITWGENVNPTGLDRGYDLVCLSILDGHETLRGAYWNHPGHQRLLVRLGELGASRFALDYIARTDAGSGEGEPS
jgi:hypothetical protein